MSDYTGNFTQDEIAQVALEVRIPEEAGVSPTQRFVKQVSNLVALRIAAGETKGVTIFLQSDALESDVEGRSWQRFPYLRGGNDPVSCKILLSNAALGTAYAVTNDTVEDQVAGVLAAGLGALPAMVVDWRGEVPKAMLYGLGVANPDDVQDVYIIEAEITADDLKAGLDEFYKKRLRTPSLVVQGHSMRIWASPSSKGWPADRPEERIQGVLLSYLYARYSRYEIRAEVDNQEGRLDLLIFAKMHDTKGAKIVKKLWILELKALTDRTSTGASVSEAVTREAIEKGLTQAISYRDVEHVNHAAVCCFDMRTDDLDDAAVFSHVQQEANDNDVHLWRWFMYRSAEASRDAARAERLAVKLA